MQNRLPNSRVMEESTCEEITNIIQNIKSKSSAGFDKIITHLMNNSMVSIALPMVEIFKSMIRSGIFPDHLRIATKVMPLYKSGNVSLFTNYRPISLVSAFSKVFERLIYNCPIYNIISQIFCLPPDMVFVNKVELNMPHWNQ